VSSAIGTGSGYGNTVSSSSGPSTSGPSGLGPSTSDQGPSGGNGSGGIGDLTPTTTASGTSTGSTTTSNASSPFVAYDLTKKATPSPATDSTYANYYTKPVSSGIAAIAPQGASFSNNYALQFPLIPKYPNLSNTNQGILDAFPVPY
jgi:hypothetical protein